MKNSLRRISLALVSIVFGLVMAPSALAATPSTQEIPLLAWERGKEQNVVLGGSTTAGNWTIKLAGPEGYESGFRKSIPNAKGFIVYSISLPSDLTLGAYRIEAHGKDGTVRVVAGVNVLERNFYTVTQIPGDLRLIFILYAILASSFSIIRGRRYSFLAFPRHARFNVNAEGDKGDLPKVVGLLEPLYTFRWRRQLNMETSFLKFVYLRDGEPLHKISPNLWSLAPFVSFLMATLAAVQMQGHAVIPNMEIVWFTGFAIIGALDGFSGITAAIGFTIAQLLFGDVNSVRNVLSLLTFTGAWFIPTMIASMYLLTLRIDYFEYVSRLKSETRMVLTIVISSLMGGGALLLFSLLNQSLVINQVPHTFTRYPLMVVVILLLIAKNWANELIDQRSLKKNSPVRFEAESLYVARVMSPGTALVLWFGLLGLVYSWTEQLIPSFYSTLLLALPFFLLFVVFPEFAGRKLPTFPRNITIETGAIALLTVAIFLAIQFLPMGVVEKSKTFILVGVIPVVIHAIYSVVVDSSERAKQTEVSAS